MTTIESLTSENAELRRQRNALADAVNEFGDSHPDGAVWVTWIGCRTKQLPTQTRRSQLERDNG